MCRDGDWPKLPDSRRDIPMRRLIVAAWTRLKLLGVALGLASLAGINLYLTVFVTGLAVHMDCGGAAAALHQLEVLGDPIIIGVAVSLSGQVFRGQNPWVDTAWDLVAHSSVRLGRQHWP